jgi:hypothetical protein
MKKKSLISTLKTTKKANVVKEFSPAKNEGTATRKTRISTKRMDPGSGGGG